MAIHLFGAFVIHKGAELYFVILQFGFAFPFKRRVQEASTRSFIS